jgi:hypothetical protein
MATLDVHDAAGDPYGGGERDERIAELAFAGVRFAVDTAVPEAVLFFRAADGGRVEQYYAVYRADDAAGIAVAARRAVVAWAEAEGLSLSTDRADARTFARLDDPERRVPGTDADYAALAALLDGGRSADVGVPAPAGALGLLDRIVRDGHASAVAVSDGGRNGALSAYGLVVEPGDHTGIEPLAGTAEPMADAAERLLAERVERVGDTIAGLRAHSERPDAELAARVRRAAPLLDGPGGVSPLALLSLVLPSLAVGAAAGIAAVRTFGLPL